MPYTLLISCAAFAFVAVGVYEWFLYCCKKESHNTSPEETLEATLLQEKRLPIGTKFSTVRGLKSRHKSYNQGTKIRLEVITGPSSGTFLEDIAEGAPWPVLTIGRSPSNSLLLNDPEVSSKHAEISWNLLLKSWQVMDKGSLNGTLLNSQPIGLSSSSGTRKDGKPKNLSDGDVIMAGSSSKILVRISSVLEPSEPAPPTAPLPSRPEASEPQLTLKAPFSVGIASDPLFSRKGAKPNPMEDVSHCEWPLRGHEDVGIFCIFDGHAGKAAAENVKRILPERLSSILKEENKFEQMMEDGTAEDVLKKVFQETEAVLPNEDEGCTATVLLVWRDSFGMFIAQAANVGDSHCVIGFGGQHLILTEDHRLSGPVERQRLESIGKPLKEGESRLCGMNIARVFGDKFLKSQDVGLSAEPYISQAVPLGDGYDTVAVIASDGLWDVISPKRAIQLVLEVKSLSDDPGSSHILENRTAGAASHLVSRAKLAKTHDNTTVVVIDFGEKQRDVSQQ